MASGNEFTIGRSSDNDLVVDDPHVSNYHAKLIRVGSGLILQDLNSSNHTFLRGKQIVRESLTAGDAVNLSMYYVLDWQSPELRGWLQPRVKRQVHSPAYSPPASAPSPPPAPAPSAKHEGKSFCPKCGARIPSATVFCGACGSNLRQPAAPPAVPSVQIPQAAALQAESIEDARMQQLQNQMKQMNDQHNLGMAKMQSLTGKAWLTLAMYYFGFYLVGLIMNLVYLGKSSTVKSATGHHPPGYGCLVFLILTHFLVPLIAVGLLLAGVFSIGEWI